MAKNKHVSGFTLIEVMIAMAIFSLVGVALMSTANTNLSNTTLLEENMMATWVASNQLVELKLQNEWPPKNNKKGDVELAKREWYWKQVVKKTTDDNLKAIIVEIRNDVKDEKPITSLMTYVSKAKQ
ncbi:MAG: type II secretion system minor pseudopilin GspI [Thalassotalea sp.]